MKQRDLAELLVLAALWGASFLFMRMGAAEFGPVTLSGLRVAGAALVLLPVLAGRGELGALRTHWKPIAIVGITNSALPFLCFSYATLTVSAGLAGVFNASAPLFGALIAWLWLGDRPGGTRIVGLLIGFAGVFGLAYDKASLPAASGMSAAPAIVACITATAAYGFSANFTKRYLTGVAPMAVAAGSQFAAALALALPAWWLWPAMTPATPAWASLASLAVACTGLAYVLYFRLIAHVGPGNAITVTYLIPAFAVAWGAIFLGERPTWAMAIGCAVILAGTALATGMLGSGSGGPRARQKT